MINRREALQLQLTFGVKGLVAFCTHECLSRSALCCVHLLMAAVLHCQKGGCIVLYCIMNWLKWHCRRNLLEGHFTTIKLQQSRSLPDKTLSIESVMEEWYSCCCFVGKVSSVHANIDWPAVWCTSDNNWLLHVVVSYQPHHHHHHHHNFLGYHSAGV